MNYSIVTHACTIYLFARFTSIIYEILPGGHWRGVVYLERERELLLITALNLYDNSKGYGNEESESLRTYLEP